MTIVPTSADSQADNSGDPRILAALAVPRGARVLAVGAGPFGCRLLRERQCDIQAVEFDPEIARACEETCESVVLAEIERLALSEAYGRLSFDAVVFLDTLACVREPLRLLSDCRCLLAEGGRVIASIPNVGHAAVRLELLAGRFHLRPELPLTPAHIRYFNTLGIAELFRQAGYAVEEKLPIARAIGETEFGIELTEMPDEILALVTREADAPIHEFVVIATPADHHAVREQTLLERLQQNALLRQQELEKRLEELRRELAEEREEFRHRLQAGAEFRLRLEIAQEALQAELEKMTREKEHALREAGEMKAQMAELEYRLAAPRYRVADSVAPALLRIPGLWALFRALDRRRSGRE